MLGAQEITSQHAYHIHVVTKHVLRYFLHLVLTITSQWIRAPTFIEPVSQAPRTCVSAHHIPVSAHHIPVSPPTTCMSPPTTYLCLRPLLLGGVSAVVDEEGGLEAAGTGRACRLVHTLQEGKEDLGGARRHLIVM